MATEGAVAAGAPATGRVESKGLKSNAIGTPLSATATFLVGGPDHALAKERQQPRAVRDTMLGRVGQESGRIFLDEMDISAREFRQFLRAEL